MKNKILVLFLAFAIMMTLMPSMAFAGVETPINSATVNITTQKSGTVSMTVSDDCVFTSAQLTFKNSNSESLYSYYYDTGTATFKWKDETLPPETLQNIQEQPDLTNATSLAFSGTIKAKEATHTITQQAAVSLIVDSNQVTQYVHSWSNGTISFNGSIEWKTPVNTLTISYPSILDKEFGGKCIVDQGVQVVNMMTFYGFYTAKDSTDPKYIVMVGNDGKVAWLDENKVEIKAEDAPANLTEFDHVEVISNIAVQGGFEFTDSTKVIVTNLDKKIQSVLNAPPSETNLCGHKIEDDGLSVLRSFYYADIDQLISEERDTESIVKSAVILAAITATAAMISNIVLAPVKRLAASFNPFVSANMFTRVSNLQRQLEQARLMLYQQIVQRIQFFGTF